MNRWTGGVRRKVKVGKTTLQQKQSDFFEKKKRQKQDKPKENQLQYYFPPQETSIDILSLSKRPKKRELKEIESSEDSDTSIDSQIDQQDFEKTSNSFISQVEEKQEKESQNQIITDKLITKKSDGIDKTKQVYEYYEIVGRISNDEVTKKSTPPKQRQEIQSQISFEDEPIQISDSSDENSPKKKETEIFERCLILKSENLSLQKEIELLRNELQLKNEKKKEYKSVEIQCNILQFKKEQEQNLDDSFDIHFDSD